jgi:hypothetical protein
VSHAVIAMTASSTLTMASCSRPILSAEHFEPNGPLALSVFIRAGAETVICVHTLSQDLFSLPPLAAEEYDADGGSAIASQVTTTKPIASMTSNFRAEAEVPISIPPDCLCAQLSHVAQHIQGNEYVGVASSN